MLKSAVVTLLLICLGAGTISPAWSRNNSKAPAEINLRVQTTADLQKQFSAYGYNEYLPLKTYQIPPLYLERLPRDWPAGTDDTLRSRLFIQILTPLALRLNQKLTAERLEIEKLNQSFAEQQKLSAAQNKRLEKLAEEYDTFTRLQGKARQEYLLAELTLKVDNIPPSLLIAAAAIATDWGTSRAARQGNALYKEYVWNEKTGLIPEDRAPGENYRIKTYPNLYASMTDFAAKINSHLNFAGFRSQRNALRRNRSSLDGRSMAHNFIFDTHLQNYAGLLDYVVTFYDLGVLDKSSLADRVEKQPVAGNKDTKNSNNDKNCNKSVIGFLQKNKLLCNLRLKNIGKLT